MDPIIKHLQLFQVSQVHFKEGGSEILRNLSPNFVFLFRFTKVKPSEFPVVLLFSFLNFVQSTASWQSPYGFQLFPVFSLYIFSMSAHIDKTSANILDTIDCIKIISKYF